MQKCYHYLHLIYLSMYILIKCASCLFTSCLFISYFSKAILSATQWVLLRAMMARDNSLTNTVLERICWVGDCLGVQPPPAKADQAGDRTFLLHLHANPLNPEVCPITHLGLALMLQSFDAKPHFLFGKPDAAYKVSLLVYVHFY